MNIGAMFRNIIFSRNYNSLVFNFFSFFEKGYDKFFAPEMPMQKPKNETIFVFSPFSIILYYIFVSCHWDDTPPQRLKVRPVRESKEIPTV